MKVFVITQGEIETDETFVEEIQSDDVTPQGFLIQLNNEIAIILTFETVKAKMERIELIEAEIKPT